MPRLSSVKLITGTHTDGCNLTKIYAVDDPAATKGDTDQVDVVYVVDDAKTNHGSEDFGRLYSYDIDDIKKKRDE
jgi:hypothetical protein